MITDILFIIYIFIGFIYGLSYLSRYVCTQLVDTMVAFVIAWPIIFIIRRFYNFGTSKTKSKPVYTWKCEDYDSYYK